MHLRHIGPLGWKGVILFGDVVHDERFLLQHQPIAHLHLNEGRVQLRQKEVQLLLVLFVAAVAVVGAAVAVRSERLHHHFFPRQSCDGWCYRVQRSVDDDLFLSFL